ncbi:hypothetical protein [Gilvimarinus sp. 1_MG-2023]|uniref:hypothetical protein n=1 Tax=Gilvimarinus sp. 1_MG-2023 TaxID=3062638 RepID=UPI0026E40322|nr:hypothetical protein [Gilvimarinus sp. 1_MG-2023]MDO6748633.1 hypothetical protein [Gilvimarinus sp. 1_MG-2023]
MLELPRALPRELYNSACIEDAVIQAAMQPWAAMECIQLGSGRQLVQMETLNLGKLQVVRETQLASVQKGGVYPSGLLHAILLHPCTQLSFLRAGCRE